MFPKKGTLVPNARSRSHGRYAAAIATALKQELGSSSQATKTLMRWTGASDRAVKYWQSGARGPDGFNLILLARNSDAVLHSVLGMADRDVYGLTIELKAAKAALLRAVALIEALGPSEP